MGGGSITDSGGGELKSPLLSSSSALKSYQQIVASSSGALLTSLMMTPFDVVKTRLQTQNIEERPMSTNTSLSSKPNAFTRAANCEPILKTVGDGPYCHKGYYILRNGLMEHICPRHGNVSHPIPSNFSPNVSACPNPVKSSTRASASANATGDKVLRFKGTFDAFVKILRHEGIASLWRGLPPTLVMAIPSTSLYFTSYDQLKSAIERRYACGAASGDYKSEKILSFAPLISGVSARAIASTVISPLELVRTKVQSQQASTGAKSLAVSREVLREALGSGVSGFLGLWRGLGATLARDLPFSGIYWMGVEFLKTEMMASVEAGKVSNCNVSVKNAPFAVNFAAGALSGMFAAVVTTPFDVVKTYQQVQLGESVCEQKVSAGQVTRQKPTLTVLRLIVRESGVRGLFVGTLARVMKVAPACAIMISSYELGKIFFLKKAGQY